MRAFCFLLLSAFVACSNPAPTLETTADWQLQPFVKADAANPIQVPDLVEEFACPVRGQRLRWAEKAVYNPASVVRNDTVFLVYRAQDTFGTSRIRVAYSQDGIDFRPFHGPVLYPDNDAYKSLEWPGGCEDPRVVQSETGDYVMTYTSYDGKTARLLVATSKDLFHWTKHGPAFDKAFNGRYRDFWSKSGSVVSDYTTGSAIAKKIDGKYWMYWGDQNIWLAHSDDLINWTPVIDSAAKPDEMLRRGIAARAPELKVVFGPRRGKWDSDLVEPGPPAMLTDSGILLIYNSRNIPSIGDSSLAEGTYAPAQILMNKAAPGNVLHRADNYLMKPDKPYEITGQVGRVCFAEGLVNFKGKWFMYYGTADSKIAVGTKQ